jgi:hypothetical protein
VPWPDLDPTIIFVVRRGYPVHIKSSAVQRHPNGLRDLLAPRQIRKKMLSQVLASH